MSMRVYDPTAEESLPSRPSAARLRSLRGCTVGLLDNSKIQVRELLNHIEDLLRTQYGVAEVLRLRKPDASRPVPPEVMASMQRCEAIISAVGD